MQMNYSCSIFKNQYIIETIAQYKIFNSSTNLILCFVADASQNSESSELERFNINERSKL